MALHLTVLSFLMVFHKDRVWGHCCLPFILANCLKSSNTIYLKHMPTLMTLSFTCRLVLTRLLIRMMRSLTWNAVYRALRISSNLIKSAKSELEDRWGKHLRKKLRYFQLLPNLAQRKLIDLANHLSSSSPCGLLTVTHRAFEILNFMASSREFLWAGFAKNGSLYRRISTKYKSSKLFWRILEDNKQNKRENWGKETLRICVCKSPIAELCATCSWNGDDFLLVLPSLRFLPSNSCIFWWILSASSCLLSLTLSLVSNSIFLGESRKQSVLVK